MLVLVTLRKDAYMYIVLGVQMVLSVLLDTFLVSALVCFGQYGGKR